MLESIWIYKAHVRILCGVRPRHRVICHSSGKLTVTLSIQVRRCVGVIFVWHKDDFFQELIVCGPKILDVAISVPDGRLLAASEQVSSSAPRDDLFLCDRRWSWSYLACEFWGASSMSALKSVPKDFPLANVLLFFFPPCPPKVRINPPDLSWYTF